MPDIFLKKIRVQGFKSIVMDNNLELGNTTIFIGANGAGKSNIISFFKMLNHLTTGSLQNFIGEQGFATSLLYYGPQYTSRLSAKLEFINKENITDIYQFDLAHASGDTLIFTEEKISYQKPDFSHAQNIPLGAGHKESELLNTKHKDNKTVQTLSFFLKNCRVFQFHDTSLHAKIRNTHYINDSRYLRDDAGNLAAFLYNLKINYEKYYERITRRIAEIFSQFDDFILEPTALNTEYIKLDWKEKNSNFRFGPHQLSDGTLRFMALTALLLQPPELIPKIIIIDEPELGLHPFAIQALAAMVKTAARYSQIILATQSSALIDEFDSSEIVIVERNLSDKKSVFKRLEPEHLKEWLKDYTLSELWEKNIFGGQP